MAGGIAHHGVELAVAVLGIYGSKLPVARTFRDDSHPDLEIGPPGSPGLGERNAGIILAVERERAVVTDDLGIKPDGITLPGVSIPVEVAKLGPGHSTRIRICDTG